MILEESPDGEGGGDDGFLLQPEDEGSARKGCNPLVQTQRSCLQNHRARINQQINREMRMRTGAENLFKATTNHRVKETVALELSYVNSNLQLLKEELEELNSSVDVYQNESEGISVPMIPLGLKETKDLDLATPLREMISEHYGEDSTSYEVEIKKLMDLRQAIRTPSRNEAGLDLLMEYYNQLYFLDIRFFSPNRNLGVFFHWYDSLTGVPSHQRTLAFEKGSVLFNIGALYTQIGARQDRGTRTGIDCAIEAFQRAAGAFNYLKENFSNAPSLDMSVASLSMLVRLMTAQVQECVFEQLTLSGTPREPLSQMRLAQEAARVEDVYSLVYQTMVQPPVRDYVPFSWTTMVNVKAKHFRGLSHYYAAIALCDGPPVADSEIPKYEKAFLQFHVTVPEGPSLPVLLQDSEERRRLAKAHLRKAMMNHEEALRLHAVCRIFRKMDLLQEVVSLAHRRSLAKYSEIDHEDDFFETAEAPDVHPKTHQKPEIKTPNFSQVKVTDIFHCLGPLSVFSAKNQWRLKGPIHLTRGEGGFGFTLRGDSPVLIAAVIPGSRAEAAGLKEGDYIVSVNGEPCKWGKHSEVVALLTGVGEEGVDIEVVTPQREEPLGLVDKKATTLSSVGLSRSDKENGGQVTLPGPFLGWNKKAKRGQGLKRLQPFSPSAENTPASH
ncbi:rhophilin-1 isoform X1 [Phascolarctos cinereus]|uniref:Rhophilin-1 isoform X1 n=1 Tax=Phascolarctos cinereus TaxID=38626 RepID=A0A6P5L5R6_PHACI|nr:rhophilin-1 isoform X1 [Phascolarctos cinereus]